MTVQRDDAARPPRPDGGVRSRLPAGILDAALASLATFVAGLAAVRVFDSSELGIYAVFFVAFVLGQLVAYQLVYVPAEIAAVQRQGWGRLGVLEDSLRAGSGPAVVGASAVLLAALTTSRIAAGSLVAGLTATAFTATFLSPTQDHLRRTLHIADRSWDAAAMSGVQFLVTVLAVAVSILLDVPAAWIPFGALTSANLASMSLGLLRIGHLRRRGSGERLTLRGLARQGRWLLIQAAIPAGAAFVTANVITFLAGPTAMGQAEAARLVAQPLLVLAAGLIYPLRPRAMEAALERNHAASRRAQSIFVGLMAVGTVLYAPLTAVVWPGNVFAVLVPQAYEVPWLVVATVGSNFVLGAIFLAVNELMAAGKAKSLALFNALGAPVRILVATSAAFVGPFARPAAEAMGELVVIAGVVEARRRIYRPR
ncbi:MAG TPA: hypothetical protein ENK55_02440 [Actinobacteria bacterium]|nr:hypothetical protein [Actinomycetota bacterium]